MMMASRRLEKLRRSARQRGASLLFALMALVALSLAAAALLRSVDTGALIIGNLGFKDDTVLASEDATRLAMNYVQTAAATVLAADSPQAGYYFNVPANLDVTGLSKDTTRSVVDWKLNDCADFDKTSYAACVKPSAQEVNLPNGVTARYLVSRLCAPGSTSVNPDCLGPTSTTKGETLDSGELKYVENLYAKSKGQQFFYRVLVRTEGTRGTITFTEAIAHNYEGEK